MTVKELSEIYGMDISAIYQRIKRNAKKLEGHITIVDGRKQLDDAAIDFLKPKLKSNLDSCKLRIDELENELKIQNQKHRDELDECSRQLSESLADYGKIDRQLCETKKELDAVIEEKNIIEQKYKMAIVRVRELEEKVALLENGRTKGIFGRR